MVLEGGEFFGLVLGLIMGLALFIAVCTLVTTGILRRFQLGKQFIGYYRTLHNGATMTFYIIVVIHILHGLGAI